MKVITDDYLNGVPQEEIDELTNELRTSGRRERGRANGNTSSVPIRDAGFAGGKTF